MRGRKGFDKKWTRLAYNDYKSKSQMKKKIKY